MLQKRHRLDAGAPESLGRSVCTIVHECAMRASVGFKRGRRGVATAGVVRVITACTPGGTMLRSADKSENDGQASLLWCLDSGRHLRVVNWGSLGQDFLVMRKWHRQADATSRASERASLLAQPEISEPCAQTLAFAGGPWHRGHLPCAHQSARRLARTRLVVLGLPSHSASRRLLALARLACRWMTGRARVSAAIPIVYCMCMP